MIKQHVKIHTESICAHVTTVTTVDTGRKLNVSTLTDAPMGSTNVMNLQAVSKQLEVSFVNAVLATLVMIVSASFTCTLNVSTIMEVTLVHVMSCTTAMDSPMIIMILMTVTTIQTIVTMPVTVSTQLALECIMTMMSTNVTLLLMIVRKAGQSLMELLNSFILLNTMTQRRWL